jgi:hypothetical protein
MKIPQTSFPAFMSALAVAALLGGCAATRDPSFDSSALSSYQNVALVNTAADELLFVTFRRHPQVLDSGPLMADGTGVAAIVRNRKLSNQITVAQYDGWVSKTKKFNATLAKNPKAEMDERLFSILKTSVESKRIKATPLSFSTDMALFSSPPEAVTKKFAGDVRSRCPTCDAALVVNAGYGFHHVPYTGQRAQAEADVLLISLVDGVIRSRATVVYTDTKNKYDYPYDTELLRDTVRAAEWLPPTVGPLAAMIFTDVRSNSR